MRTARTPPLRTAALIASMAVLCLACSRRPTGLVIHIATDLDQRTELHDYSIVVRTGGPASNPYYTSPDYLPAQHPLPATAGIWPTNVSAHPTLDVTVIGHLVDGSLITQRATITLQYEHTFLLEMFLARGCENTDPRSVCPEGQTCTRDHMCRPVEQPPIEYPDGGVPVADSSEMDVPSQPDGMDAPTDQGSDVGTDTGNEEGMDTGGDAGTTAAIDPPRLIAPLSLSTVSSGRVTLRWLSAPGPRRATRARAESCRDRAMTLNCIRPPDGPADGSTEVLLAPGIWFWRVLGLDAAGATSASSAIWELSVSRSACVGVARVTGSFFDTNGDGLNDLAVGAPGNGANTGYVNVYLGQQSGAFGAPTTLTGPLAFGSILATAGDVNGDGFGDLLASDTTTRTVRVYTGSATGISPARHSDIVGPQESFGGALAGLGDTNGDGYGDILVSSTLYLTVGLYFGSPVGITMASYSPLATAPGAGSFGISVAASGDFNADGFADAVLGSPVFTGTGNGAAYVYVGSASGGLTSAVTLNGTSPQFGHAVSGGGDVNGDCVPDVVVLNSGGLMLPFRAFVFAGPSTMGATLSEVESRSMQVDTTPQYTSYVGPGGDIDEDGYGDIVVGFPGDIGSLGHVSILFGGSSGLNPTPRRFDWPVPSERFGASIAANGDFNGDGHIDLIVGASNGNSSAGFVNAYSNAGTASFTLNPTGGGADHFGTAVAF